MKREIIWEPECSHFRIAKVVIDIGTVKFELIPRGQKIGTRYQTNREALNAAVAGCRLRHCSRVKPKLVWKLEKRGSYSAREWRIEQRMHRTGGRNPERMWDLSFKGEHMNYYESVQECRDAAERFENGHDIRPPGPGRNIVRSHKHMVGLGVRFHAHGLSAGTGWNTAGNT